MFFRNKNWKKNKYKIRNENNRFFKNNIKDCNLLIIPTKNNVLELIEKILISILHQAYFKIKNRIKELGIFYHGINDDIDNIKHLCSLSSKKL